MSERGISEKLELHWNKLLADHKDNLISVIYSADEQHQCPKEFQHIDDPEIHDCYCFICRYYSGVPQHTLQCPCYYYGKQESFDIAKQRLAIEGMYPISFE